ncbi:MAG: hypothetical protein ACXVCZ_21835, partial [Bdellovibrionota bacterium]
ALTTLLFGGSAQAITTPIYKQDGSQATILLAGMPGDSDPSGFYNALTVPPEDFQGKWSKRFSLHAADGSPAFDIACVFSKMIVNSGTCTVIFRKSPGLIDVSASDGRARLWLSGAAAVKFAAAFAVRDESTLVFRSRDGRFNVTVARDRGVITDFVMDWNGKGI